MLFKAVKNKLKTLMANTYLVDFSEVFDADSVTTLSGLSSEVLDVVVVSGSGSFCAEQLDAKTILQNTMTNFMKSIVLLLML